MLNCCCEKANAEPSADGADQNSLKHGCQLVAGKGKGMAGIVSRIVQRLGSGKAGAEHQERSKCERQYGGKARLGPCDR